MMLKLFKSERTRSVSAEEVRNYRTFSKHDQENSHSKELQVFERFYAVRSLLEQGMKTFLDPAIGEADAASGTRVDAAGTLGESMTIVLCEPSTTDPFLLRTLELVADSTNARAIILAPTSLDTGAIEEAIPDAFTSGKISLEHLGWFDDHFDIPLQETLKLIDLLGNETRMRMLTPLFRRTSDKREYRTTINPKLVYKNLEVLSKARLVDEGEAGYELSGLGKTILAEFITFLEKTRKALDLATREKGGENE